MKLRFIFVVFSLTFLQGNSHQQKLSGRTFPFAAGLLKSFCDAYKAKHPVENLIDSLQSLFEEDVDLPICNLIWHLKIQATEKVEEKCKALYIASSGNATILDFPICQQFKMHSVKTHENISRECENMYFLQDLQVDTYKDINLGTCQLFETKQIPKSKNITKFCEGLLILNQKAEFDYYDCLKLKDINYSSSTCDYIDYLIKISPSETEAEPNICKEIEKQKLIDLMDNSVAQEMCEVYLISDIENVADLDFPKCEKLKNSKFTKNVKVRVEIMHKCAKIDYVAQAAQSDHYSIICEQLEEKKIPLDFIQNERLRRICQDRLQ